MRKFIHPCLPAAAAALLSVVGPTRAENIPIRYAVGFNGSVVATQTVEIAESGGLTTVSASFAADLPVFIARHVYSEDITVTARADGSVQEFRARVADGPIVVETSGIPQEDGSLLVVRSGPDGMSSNRLVRTDYDCHSLALYGTAPTNFLPDSRPVRMLDLARGEIVPTGVEVIFESYTTPERQNVDSAHVVWTSGSHVSHSWHPERYSDLPVRFVRSDAHGRFEFNLQR